MSLTGIGAGGREEHPRTGLTRAEWFDLGGRWGFAYDDADRGLAEGWSERADVFDREIVVPFPPESTASGIGERGFHRVVWYRRGFRVPETALRGPVRWLLHFGAVDYRAQVWVNGRQVVTHEGGHMPFSADVTAALRPDGGEQVVVVRAEDEPEDLTQPRGKQYWERDPGEIWYHRTTGIWQPVWLEPVPETRIEDVRWTTDLDRGRIGVEVRLNRAPERPLRLRLDLTLRGEPFAQDTYVVDRREIQREIAFDIPNVAVSKRRLLWAPEHPNLLDANLRLEELDANAPPLDEVSSYLGLRTAGYRGGRFLLNGKPYYLRMALAQGYWPETHLAAPSGADIRREVEGAKSLGLNGLRLHQKVEDPRYLYWCDRVGLVVWGEMPNAYAFSTTAIERLTREWIEVLRRDYSHPCIVTWVPFNESWGVPNLEGDETQRHYVRALYHLTHALDPTRPVIGNDGWENFATDIWGIHDYALESETLRERYGSGEAVARTVRDVQPYLHTLVLPGHEHAGEPVMLTEVGGIDFVVDEGPDGPRHPRKANDPDEFLVRYADLIRTIVECPTIQGFCYTQLTDTEQELSGLLTADRRPKHDPAEIRRITTLVATAVPAQTTFGADNPVEMVPATTTAP